jgi:hypothetical protein
VVSDPHGSRPGDRASMDNLLVVRLWVADVRLARLQQDRDRSPILLPSSLSDAPAASAMCAGVKDGPPDKTPCNLSCGEWAVAVVVQEACKISVVVTRL